MLVNMIALLKAAQAGGYAVGAFNVYNLEGVSAVIAAAEQEHSPVILQIHPKAMIQGGHPFADCCLSAAKHAAVPVGVHLDHSSSAGAIQQALAAGFTSVMADGASLSYEDNLRFSTQMAALAHEYGASIEAELGQISGTEDDLIVSENDARMTDPQQAAVLVAASGVDALAVCIGNVHGVYRGEPRLDFNRLAAIRRLVDVPLVLHGASGLSEVHIHEAIALGVCKFNVNTEVRQAYLDAARALFQRDTAVDLIDVMQAVTLAMKHVVIAKIHLFASNGKVNEKQPLINHEEN